MEYLIKNQPLQLIHQPGKGAWTYHIQIPNTRHLVGKWGTMKVAGFVNDYKIDSINLFTIRGQDKLISINSSIRKAINKTGGDWVTVTLYLLGTPAKITATDILETLDAAGVLPAFQQLPTVEQQAIISRIMAQPSADKQTQLMIKQINRLVA